MSDCSFWIIATMGVSILVVLLIISIVLLWIFAKPEGRHHIRKSVSGGGVDNLRHEPLSNKLHLGTIKWDGQHFQSENGIYYLLRAIKNPNKAQELYNQAIESASRWAGSNRPVIMTTDLMSFAVGPAFYAALEKAKHTEEYKEQVKFLEGLSEMFKKHGVDHFSFVETFDIQEINKYIRDVGPKKIKDSFKNGAEAERLKNVKEPNPLFGGGGWWIYILVLIVVAAIGFGLLQSGMLDQFLG